MDHFREFMDCKDIRIWIGSFADAKNQKESKIELVETLLIQAYGKELTENKRKKVGLPRESVCLINLWFDKNERLKVYNIDRPCFDDVVMFEKPRGIVPGKVFEVMQVLPDGSALATVDDFESDNLGTIVLFVGDESTSYYDSQKINVPEGKVVKQVGTYSYMARNEMYKTVPVVEIMAE